MYYVPFSKRTALSYLGLIVSFLAMTLVTLSNEIPPKRHEPVMINIKIIGTNGTVSLRSAPLIPVTVVPIQDQLVDDDPLIEETVVSSISIDHPVALPLPHPIPTPTLAPPPEIDYTNAVVSVFDKTPVMIIPIDPPINHVAGVTIGAVVTPMLHATIAPQFFAASINNPILPRTVTVAKPEVTVEIGIGDEGTPTQSPTFTMTPTPHPTPTQTDTLQPTSTPVVTDPPPELPTIDPLASPLDTPIPDLP